MKRKLNIGIGKFGASLEFNPDKWDMKGGEYETPQFILNLAQLHPEWNIYILCKSNFEKFWHKQHFKNVINTMPEKINSYTWMNDYFVDNNIKLDYAFIYCGLTDQVNIPNFSEQIRTPGVIAKPRSGVALQYAAPLIHFLNESSTPYCEVGDDPRYMYVPARDLYNRAKFIISSQTGLFFSKHRVSKEDSNLITTTCRTIDFDHHTWFLANEVMPKSTLRNREILFSLFSNYSGNRILDKQKIIEDYIWKFWPETKVYGDWKTELIKPEYENNIVGVPMYRINDILRNTKYTIMLSALKTDDKKPWLTTAKLWKMLMFGIIPFFILDDDINHYY